MSDRQRADTLGNKYNIPDPDYIFGILKGISVSLEEDLHNSWKKSGVIEALESGEVVSKDEHNSQRIDDYAWTVSNLMKKGFSLDEALETSVPNDIREAVREKVISINK